MNALLECLISWDRTVFEWINSGCGNPVFDVLLPWFRERLFWAPLYLFLVSFLWINFRKKGLLMMLTLGLAVGLTDFTSSNLIKKNVERLRPCRDEAMQHRVILRTECGSGYSFTSSHAANHFAAAVCIIGFLGPVSRWIKPLALTWAGIISLSQVYVGLHYPGDVLAGALTGVLIGWCGVRIYFFFFPATGAVLTGREGRS